MKLLFVFLSLFIPFLNASQIPKICYSTVEATEFCTTDHLGNVQVFLYNAGWCPPCNSEMSEISAAYSQFEGKKVTFASLSGEGFQHGKKPDQAFLKSWKEKHKIPFVVAGKYKDFGENFGTTGYIPFAVIVDSKGVVAQTGNLSVTEILSKVKELLPVEEITVDTKAFFEKIRGNYNVELVAGAPPHDPTNQASIYFDVELSDLETVYMPYCVEEVCMDSGNQFVYANTIVTKTEKGYQLVLKAKGKELRYDWEEDATGKVLYRNYQFVGQDQNITIILEHNLKRVME